jgi:tricarballylate dehydrogenase
MASTEMTAELTQAIPGAHDELAGFDVVVVGGGNAGLCAAIAAADAGAKVLVLERAPFEERGGNSAFTGGGLRFPFRDESDLLQIVRDLTQSELDKIDFDSYSELDYFTDIANVTENRADPDLAELVVTKSFDTLRWMADKGVRFLPSYERYAFEVNGRYKFGGGAPLEAAGGGPGLVDSLTRSAEQRGVTVVYNARAVRLVSEDAGPAGLIAKIDGTTTLITAGAIVLAAGGFQANAEWRARYLGPGWDLAKVRGTRFNTGDGIRMALDIGAMPWGHWSGCHSVAWDLNAPDFGDLEVGHGFNKHSYFLGIMVNSRGERFVDEGADLRNLTYAQKGRETLAQPGQFAWQIFDSRVADLLTRGFYRIPRVTRVVANTLEELVTKLEGVDPDRCLATIRAFNAAATSDKTFDPVNKDGRATVGLAIPKSNWANPIDTPPFEAFAVTCGITFTFGGLRITTESEVMNTDGAVIPHLYACGELAAGLFYFNYPGSTGLTWGSVMGKIAGEQAAVSAKERAPVMPGRVG